MRIRTLAGLVAIYSMAWWMVIVVIMRHPGTAQGQPLMHRLPSTYITGYCDRGTTYTGTWTHWGEVAVDPYTIPLGSWVRIRGLGTFHAEDTGGEVIGDHVDVWTPTCAMAYRITGYRPVTWWKGSRR